MVSIIADLHTHTLASTHAFDTLDAMTAAAAQLGYKAIAMTDHASAMPDSPHIWHFGNWSALPRSINNVVVLHGAEANVMDTKGGIDIAEEELQELDWVVASIHSACVPGALTKKEATRLWLCVAESPYIDCIGHSEQMLYSYDYDTVIKAFAKYGKVVEMNGNSFNIRKAGIPNMRIMLAACEKYGCRIALNSDAHSVGQMQTTITNLYELVEENNFPQELIANATCENLVQVLKDHNKKCADELGGILL